jgi:hypothetical protein
MNKETPRELRKFAHWQNGNIHSIDGICHDCHSGCTFNSLPNAKNSKKQFNGECIVTECEDDGECKGPCTH